MFTRTNDPAKDWDTFCDATEGPEFESVPEEYHISMCCQYDVKREGNQIRCKSCGCFAIVDEVETIHYYLDEMKEYQAECKAEAQAEAMEDLDRYF